MCDYKLWRAGGEGTIKMRLWGIKDLRYLSHVSVQFNCSVVSDSLRHHRLQHTRLPCPSPTPRGCSNSCPLSPVMPSNHVILCHPLLLPPSIFPSIRVFSNESVIPIRWAKVLEFQLQHQSFQWIFRDDFPYDWLVRSPCSLRTLKSLLQHHSSKASILQCSAFFIVQLSHLYMTTGKTILPYFNSNGHLQLKGLKRGVKESDQFLNHYNCCVNHASECLMIEDSVVRRENWRKCALRWNGTGIEK